MMYRTMGASSSAQKKKSKPQIKWTDERVNFLRDNYPVMKLPELTKAFNKQFSTSITEKAVGFQLSRRCITKKKLAA